jgi:hypothetical protein
MAYSQQSDVENVFGIQNVLRWSNLDNNAPTADTNRIAVACSLADEYINNRLTNSIYLIPLQIRGNAGVNTMYMITDLSARWAGCWLYESRGMADNQLEDGEIDATGNAISRHRKYVDKMLDQIRQGKILLPCVYIRNYTTQPQVFG